MRAQAQIPCVDGYAGIYPCENVDLVAHLDPVAIGGGTTNEVWGWTDPLDGTEYVLLGKSTGVAFFDISDPVQPLLLGTLPTHTSNSLWRTLRVYDDHLFVGSEANGHGLQVFDLTQLRNVIDPPVTFAESAHYAGFGKCHTLVIDEENGLLYACGTNTFSGGLHIVDIQDPLQPVIAGGYSEDGYTHEAQVVVYDGPDADYTGHTIVFCYNGNNPATLTIVDATDPTDVQTVSITPYPQSAYCHQGWLTPDGNYLLMDDELDEYTGVFSSTRTLIWDMHDLDAPQFMGNFLGTTEAVDHNQYIIGNLAFQSNYTAGLRLVDITDIADTSLQEVGYFDHYPENNDNVFDAQWMNYPYFASGVIPLTDIDNGMFLVRVNFLELLSASLAGCSAEGVSGSLVLSEGFAGPVELSASGLPEGVSILFSEQVVQAPDTVDFTIQGWSHEDQEWNVTIHAQGEFFSYSRSMSVSITGAQPLFVDADGDGWGSAWAAPAGWACAAGPGTSLITGDCDDASAVVYPGAPGTSGNVDNNCDGEVNGYELAFCPDVDGDGVITVNDLFIVSGTLGCNGTCVADVNEDGSVDISDLIAVITAFGMLCE